MLKKLSIGAVAALTFISAPALAIPYQSATVYKTSIDGIDQIIFSATANTRVAVSIENQVRNSGRIAGTCGEVKISSSTGDYSGLTVDDTAVDSTALSVLTLPSCVSGTFAEARTANFKTPTGQIVVVGKTPGSAVKVNLPSDVIRYVTINGCGFGILKATTSSPIPASFKVGTVSYTFSGLTTSPGVPLCRSSNGVYTGYVPSGW
jgi:translation initiation factor IF-1